MYTDQRFLPLPMPTPAPQSSRETTTNFAKAIIAAGGAVGSDIAAPCARILDLLRRDAVLRKGAIQVHQDTLARSRFSSIGPIHDEPSPRLPLCAADERGEVWSEAARLSMMGVPVSLDRGADGKRRGTPLADVVDAANDSGMAGRHGGRVDELDVLRWLEEATLATGRRLRSHPNPKYAKIPALRDRIELAIRHTEQVSIPSAQRAYCEVFNQQIASQARFIAWLDAESLSALLSRAAVKSRHAKGGEPAEVAIGAGSSRDGSPVLTAAGRAARCQSVIGRGLFTARAQDVSDAARKMLDAGGDGIRAILFAGLDSWHVVAVRDDGAVIGEASQYPMSGE